MARYKAYGLVLSSPVDLPELLPTEEPPDVSIRFSSFQEESPCVDAGGFCVDAQIPGELRFQVRQGREIVLEKLGDISAEQLRAYLLGVIMAVLLRQRGLLTIHASALARDGRAIGFVGDSGWGKSTLAGYFVREGGFKLLNDDVMAVDVRTEPVQLLPGFAQIKFRPDAEAWLGSRYGEMPHLHGNSYKRVDVQHGVLAEEAVPLERLYLLEPVAREASRVTEVSSRNALLEIIAHTRVTNVMFSPKVMAEHFKQCEALLRGVAIKRLERKRDLNALSDILAVIERDLA